MTNRLTLGIDPGVSGAIALLSDGEPAGFIDIPLMDRVNGGNEIDGKALGAALRGIFAAHRGAWVCAVVEQVNAMPAMGKGAERRTMGSRSAFNFGESFGKLKCALEILDIPYVLVEPRKWKASVGLLKTEKDESRRRAIDSFPAAAHDLQRKKDCGRADALWIARYGDLLEAKQVAA
jgi:crossover junction endodeoxyribonuclease RuvC